MEETVPPVIKKPTVPNCIVTYTIEKNPVILFQAKAYVTLIRSLASGTAYPHWKAYVASLRTWVRVIIHSFGTANAVMVSDMNKSFSL
jgi:hypothetical protein